MINIKILVATHKLAPMPLDNDLHLPILVGATKNYRQEITYQRDDDGKNISEKNPNYNELTAIYWAWKNLKNVDAIGLVHYRRFFFKANTFSKDLKEVIDQSDIENMLKNHDVILPKKRNYVIETNYSHYIHAHHKEPIDKVKEILKENHPDYLKSFEKVMSRRKAHMFNMFIMKKQFFDDYVEWMMEILFKLEEEIDISQYSIQEARVFGYIGELLMDIWIDKNDINYTETSWKQTGKLNLMPKIFHFLKRKFLPRSDAMTHF